MSAQMSRRSLVIGTGGGVVAAAGASLLGAESAHAAVPTMTIGSRGWHVQQFQTALASSGYWLGAADGVFGQLTQQAVWALQKTHGLRRTGVIDEALWNSGLARVRAQSKLKQDGIEIDLAKQTLMIVKGGVVHLTLNTSTGNGERFEYLGGWATAITPKGTFKIYRKAVQETSTNAWVEGPLGRMYRPRFFTTTGIAVHGSLSIPPYPASHGCIRLNNSAQDYLLRTGRLVNGTDVRIY